jgi:uncharacterized protein YyaL (SSP411 family)
LALFSSVARLSLPGAVQQVLNDATRIPASSTLSGKKTRNGKATAYVCVGPQCSAPIFDAEGLSSALRQQRMAHTASA